MHAAYRIAMAAVFALAPMMHAPGLGQAEAGTMTVYKSPTCGCCSQWVDHIRASGLEVVERNVDDLTMIKQMSDVPERLHACHTAAVDGYVIEGHVPAHAVHELLQSRPEIGGIAAPGMPEGSPGMPSPTPEVYDVIAFGKHGPQLFGRYRGDQPLND